MKETLSQLSGQLTQREKRLLYFMTCFLLVIAGWFLLITPALDKKSQLEEKYQNVLSENASKQTQLSLYLSAPDELKIKKDSLNQLIEKYNPILTNEKIDKLLTSIFLSQGLTPKSLSIGEVTAANAKNDKTEEKKEDAKDSTAYVYQTTVNVTVSGTVTKLTNTIETIHKQKGIQVSSFSYSEANGLTSETTASLSLIVYMTAQ